MNTAIAFLILLFNFAQDVARPELDPPVIGQMEELGTVYVTRRAPKSAPKVKTKKGPIIGIDFRPMAGSDPKKVAAAVKELASLPELETVLLLGRDVTDEAADAIPKSATLVSVQFFNTSITDNGIGNLTRFTKLQTFKFTGMGLTDRGMKALAKISTLQTIEVTDSKVTDEGVLALQSLPNLRQLTIENTAASQRSIDQLGTRLPRIEGRRSLR